MRQKSARSLHKNYACVAQLPPATPRGFRSRPNQRIMVPVVKCRMPKVPDPSFPTNFPAVGQPVDELALAEIKSAILGKLRLAIGKDAGMATRHDWYKAAALGCATASCTIGSPPKSRATTPAPSGSITSHWN